MKIVTVVGARPQFIKAAAFSRALRTPEGSAIQELMLHTGQHHDEMMSGVFFEELGMAAPKWNLGVAGGSHGAMTGRMLAEIETVLVAEAPDYVLIYGDTNSTLAAVLAASKLHIPVAHVEAGLRSFNMRMPEEVNRIVADRLSSLLLCPTTTAVEHLAREGMTGGVHLVGDIMYDAALHFAALAAPRTGPLFEKLKISRGEYILATIHRAENVDHPEKLRSILRGLAAAADLKKVVFPVHPRTRARVRESGAEFPANVEIIDPVSFLDMVILEKNASLIITDSGGVQKEAFFYGVPCVTVREESEWMETVASGWNILAGADADKLVAAIAAHQTRQREAVSPYGSGDAAMKILGLLLEAGAR